MATQKKRTSDEELVRLADQIEAGGGPLSVSALMRAAGGGSYKRLSRFLEQRGDAVPVRRRRRAAAPPRRSQRPWKNPRP